MKKLISLIVLCVFLTNANAQLSGLINAAKNYNDSNIVTNATRQITAVKVNTAFARVITALKYADSLGVGDSIRMNGDTLQLRKGRAGIFRNQVRIAAGGSILPGGPITTLPGVGNNPGTNITSDQFITSQFYGTQPPTASLTGGGTFEFTSASTQSATLNWSAGRNTATNPLASIVITGNSQTFTQTFSQPAQGASVSGTQAVTVPTNTTTTYTVTVTTTDGKTATTTTTFYYQNKIYAGFVTSATPTDAEIIAATGSSYVGGVFSGSRNQSGSLSTPSATKYYVFVSPASYGTPNIIINGLGVTFNQTTRTFVNAGGYSSSYIIAVSPFPTAGQIDSYLVN